MAKGIFVSATGTGQGKTWLTAELLKTYRMQGIEADALKPVLSGFGPDSDAHILLEALGHASDGAALEAVSRYRLDAPLSPDHAAARENASLLLGDIAQWSRSRMERRTEAVWLVEGAGGVASPIATDGLNVELARALDLPVLLVARCYLGSIGHALAAVGYLQAHDMRAAVVLNAHGAEVDADETASSLRRFMPAGVPLIGTFDSSGVSRECFARIDELAQGRDGDVGSVQA